LTRGDPRSTRQQPGCDTERTIQEGGAVVASTKKTWASAVRRPIAIGAGALALIGGAVMMPATASAATTAPTTTPAPTSTQPATTPSVPTPVIHLGEVCLTSDGAGVKPYDLSFTWDGQKGKTYGVTFSFTKV